MVIWDDFPAEVRLLILSNLAQAVLSDDNDVLADYSAVCKEWQDLAERQLFKSLTISQRDMASFDRIVRGSRRKWLQHLRLHIKLPTYNSRRTHM
jgi:dihydroneopterin aldolase